MNNLGKLQKRIIIIAIILVIGIIGYYIYGRENETKDIIQNDEIMVKNETRETEEKSGKIIVHITGEVKKEGVYTLEENSRVTDAVEAAGGLTEDADMNKINLAYVLEDGVKIKIPSKNEQTETNEDTEFTEEEQIVENYNESKVKSEDSIVNINKATQTELETLPGIGPSTAMKIINYRKEHGMFSNIEDLKNVDGVGENRFEKIKDLIIVK